MRNERWARHTREGGCPVFNLWIPACAGMTLFRKTFMNACRKLMGYHLDFLCHSMLIYSNSRP